MITVNHLSCGYGGPPVVKEVSFRVQEGERFCILGPNGCGKTTLLRAMAGLLPFSGTVVLDGSDLRSLSARKRAQKLALMSQLTPAAFGYTVEEAVMMGRYARRTGGPFTGESAKDRRIAQESMELTGIWELRDRLITRLSGGQLQRVYLARTFAQEPQVILLDEPTNHLDLRCQVELIESLRTWVQTEGRCIVGVLHDIDLALSFADTVLLMEEGVVLAQEAVEGLDLSLLDRLYGMDVRGHMKAAAERWK